MRLAYARWRERAILRLPGATIMKHAQLAGFKHHTASISPRDMWVRTNTDTMQEAAKKIAGPSQTNDYGDGVLDLSASEQGTGVWIPYQAKSNVYGYLTSGQTWAASGPFSGCYFYLGRHADKIYAAHVSCEGPSDANVAEWEKSEFAKNALFKKKIGMAESLPLGSRGAAAVIFANVAGDNIEVTRVDIRTENAGSMSGMIFAVEKIESD